MAYECFDMVVVPLPFVESAEKKRRPALVLSQNAFNQCGHSVLAMITTRRHPAWPGDTKISETNPAGLHLPCIVRLKLFTLDNRLIIRNIGRLSKTDMGQFRRNASPYLSL